MIFSEGRIDSPKEKDNHPQKETTMADSLLQSNVERFIAAYNSFDLDGMAALLHPDIVFRNGSGGTVTAETKGLAAFRELAGKSASLFSAREQKPVRFDFQGGVVRVQIDFSGALAGDLPNGLKAGQEIRLSGHSEYEFQDGLIIRLTDFS